MSAMQRAMGQAPKGEIFRSGFNPGTLAAAGTMSRPDSPAAQVLGIGKALMGAGGASGASQVGGGGVPLSPDENPFMRRMQTMNKPKMSLG